MGSLSSFLQQPLTKNFIQLAIWVGGAWLIGLLLLPFVFDSLWGVVARHFLSGLLQQNLIVESLPWRTWLKPIAVVQLAVAAPFVVTVVAIVVLATLFIPNPSENFSWGIMFSVVVLPASALVILIYFVIVIPFLVRYVWQWACREMFPNAVASGLVSPNITWTVGFALLFLWFISSLLASLPNIAINILEIIRKTSS
jgi:hypothetical protein